MRIYFMKRLCLAAAIIILGISALHAAGAGPRINAIGKEWDLGNVPMGGKAEKVFEISNGGSSDLVIENVKSCCGYSVTDISSWKIKPGKRSKFRVSVDASRKGLGTDRKEIMIRSNDKESPMLRVPVRSEIVKKRSS